MNMQSDYNRLSETYPKPSRNEGESPKRHVPLYLALAGIFAMPLVSCKKEDEKEKKHHKAPDTEQEAPEQAADVAGVYTAIDDQLGALNLTVPNQFLSETWSAADWTTNIKFAVNDSQNATALDYIKESLNPDGHGAVGSVKKEMQVICIVGALFPAAEITNGLPNVRAEAALTVDATTGARLIDLCGAKQEDVDNLASAPPLGLVEEVGGEYDRKITLTFASGFLGASGAQSFYLKNSDGIIAVAALGQGDNGTIQGPSRAVFKIDLVEKVFRFESFWHLAPEAGPGETDDLGLVRGYRSETTGRFGFLEGAKDRIFMSLQGVEGTAQAGVYIAGPTKVDNTVLTGGFVCFNPQNGAFVNATGCTLNSPDDLNTT